MGKENIMSNNSIPSQIQSLWNIARGDAGIRLLQKGVMEVVYSDKAKLYHRLDVSISQDAKDLFCNSSRGIVCDCLSSGLNVTYDNHVSVLKGLGHSGIFESTHNLEATIFKLLDGPIGCEIEVSLRDDGTLNLFYVESGNSSIHAVVVEKVGEIWDIRSGIASSSKFNPVHKRHIIFTSDI